MKISDFHSTKVFIAGCHDCTWQPRGRDAEAPGMPSLAAAAIAARRHAWATGHDAYAYDLSNYRRRERVK